MKTVVVALLCCSLVFATSEYTNALRSVLSRAPMHTLRLTEVQAKVEAQAPMDQVGTLCYQQMQEITMEVDSLDETHGKFQDACRVAIQNWGLQSNQLFASRSRAVLTSAHNYGKWNRVKSDGNLEDRRKRRNADLKTIHKLEGDITKAKRKRADQVLEYNKDLADFGQALKDLDGIRKVLANSALGATTTSANTAAGANGFLEVVDNVQSEYFKYQTGRLVRAGKFLEEQTEEGAPSGVDKVNNLIFKIRNELNVEVSKLTAIEMSRINSHKMFLLRYRRIVNALHMRRARNYIKMGQQLSYIGHVMKKEADKNVESSMLTKRIDKVSLQVNFEQEKCDAEPALYQKMRSNKIAEIATLKLMINILKNLNWSGAVYQAIARISLGGVDENPEPGFNLGYQMDITNGLGKQVYAISNNEIKDFGRVAIKLQIGSTWVWASFEAFSQSLAAYLMPSKTNGVYQDRYVKNLHVHKSASAKVSEGNDSAQGNLEIWANKYEKSNAQNIPGADDGAFDFGDSRSAVATELYGCFQVHDYLNKQTLLAINNLFAKDSQYDVGIGNQAPGDSMKQPDWTFSKNFPSIKARKSVVTLTWYFQPKSYKKEKPSI